jgi:hypothetical protein
MIRKHVDGVQASIQSFGATWTTASDTMPGVHACYLQSLRKEAGVVFDPRLTKTEATKRIEELHRKTGRNWEH